MTQSPPPPWAPGQPPRWPVPPPVLPRASAPRRRRPSAWWFAVGGGLVVAAAVAGIALFVWTLSSLLGTDATVRADGEPHAVTVPTDGDRALWVRQGDPGNCTVVDSATDTQVSLTAVGGSFTRSDGSGTWVAQRRFDPGSGSLVVTCAASGAPVQIGAAPQIGGFVGGILATVLVPLVLGGLGVVCLIVTTILFATGRPRNEPA